MSLYSYIDRFLRSMDISSTLLIFRSSCAQQLRPSSSTLDFGTCRCFCVTYWSNFTIATIHCKSSLKIRLWHQVNISKAFATWFQLFILFY